MSQVAPNGVIRLFKDVPLDTNHEDTVTFATRTAQETYFLGLTPVHVMQNSTRVRDGVISLNVGEDSIREANYMMFQNQNFADKWFYAYVLHTEYVNPNMTYVYYKIDAMQTYGLDIQFKECFVEREHTITDAIGEHTIAEGVGAPELKVDSNIGGEGFNEGSGVNLLDAIVFTSSQMNQGNWETCDVHSLNSLLCMYEPTVRADGYVRKNGQGDPMVSQASWSVLQSVLQDLIENNHSESIIGGIIMPSQFSTSGSLSQGREKHFVKSSLYTGLDGYTPKNNKMYNSPYCVVRLQMSDGQCVFLQPEYLTGSDLGFRIISVCSMTPELAVIPMDYKGQDLAYAEALSFTAFPQFSVAVDGYKAWVASGGLERAKLELSQIERSASVKATENAINGMTDIVSDIGNVVASGMTAQASGGTVGAKELGQSVASLVKDTTTTVATAKEIENSVQFANENFDLQNAIAKTFPPTNKGRTLGSALASDLKIGYTVDKMTINKDNAKAIDDYFTMYGYQVNTVKVPSLKNRTRFTYVKTKGCKVVGGAPTEIITEIEAIMNRGCRFWQSASDIGNYDTPNTPLGNNP